MDSFEVDWPVSIPSGDCESGLNILYEWMETQTQTNGNAITVAGQKPMLDNSMDKDRIAIWALSVDI